MLNPDVRLTPHSVPPLLAALQEPGTGIVVPQLRSPDGGLEPSLRRDADPAARGGPGEDRDGRGVRADHQPGRVQLSAPVDWAQGAVVLMSRDCFDKLSGWDESFFLYSEETDFSLRARDLGLLTRYEPGSVAVHIGGPSGRNNKTHAMQIINRVRLYRRRNSVLASWCYYWLTIASELTWVARGHPQSWFAIAGPAAGRRCAPPSWAARTGGYRGDARRRPLARALR